MRTRVKAFADKYELSYSPNLPIYRSVNCRTLTASTAFSKLMYALMTEYGIHRYTYEMWSEIVETRCFKDQTAVFKEWGVGCAYCLYYNYRFNPGGCYMCPLESCDAGSHFVRWTASNDIDAAKAIRDIAKERMDGLS